MSTMLFVYNPNAGKGLIRNKLSTILEYFAKEGYQVTVRPTLQRKDATNVVAEYGKYFDRIVCSGGDGTLNEVTDGLMTIPEDVRPICGYIPTGTTNDFASSLKIPKKVMQAAELAVHGEPFPYDIGCINGDYFTYIAGFGAFTDVAYVTPQVTKNVLGKMAYFLEGVKKLPSIRSYKLKIERDGEIIEDDIIYGMVTNSKSVGGFKGYTGKHVRQDDGLFECSFVKAPKNPLELQATINDLLKKQLTEKHFYFFRAAEVKITCAYESIPWTIDGEYGGDIREAVITNYHQAVQFLRPQKN